MQNSLLYPATRLPLSRINYRARVSELPNGDTLIQRVKVGSRGSLYTEPLIQTAHGRLVQSLHQWHFDFDMLRSEPTSYVAACLAEETELITHYLRSL